MKNKPILFCDFYKTICHDLYWRSLPPEANKKLQECLFQGDSVLVNSWMRGEFTAEEINEMAAQNIGIHPLELWRVFVRDCEDMHVPQAILDNLHRLRKKFHVVLMTDNMDSFSRFTVPALGLENYFDYISNSYFKQKLKTDNEGEIFSAYAKKREVPLAECVLLDDSTIICSIFEHLGGKAYLVTKEDDARHHLNYLVS